MSRSPSARIDELFHAALELPPEERASLLDLECGSDAALRREVESLLEADEAAGDFLEKPVVRLAGRCSGPDHELGDGTEVGPYRLLRTLGEGDSCTVYLAERSDAEYRKRVAIKLVRPGLDSEQILLRFQRERQILAALEHPHIARLLDGGRDDSGRPYFVMEYVEGRRIDDYCDHRRLSLRARIGLFRGVCAAVHFAHGKLVVHRDLKPSNILVTDEGEVKLLDFGIAKLLDPALSEQELEATSSVVRMMTPGYASPEQVRGEPVATTSDVYSLGILLYELLTGVRPYSLRGLALREIERVVCGGEIEPPSAAVRRREAGVEDTKGAGLGGPEMLSRRLAGDLDTIVMMALRKEPERRYRSVQELSEDLRRHLERLPVSARRDTAAYRIGRFIRRHAVGVASLTLVVVALATAAGVTGWQARVARAERTIAETQRLEAEEQRRRAQLERLRAEQVSDFLVELFAKADPYEVARGEITLREALDLGAEKVRAELGDQPEVQAELQVAIGHAYLKLGLPGQAVGLLEEALAIFRREPNDDIEGLVNCMQVLAMALTDLGDFRGAETLLREALERTRSSYGRDHEYTVEAYRRLAGFLSRTGNPEGAYRITVELLEFRRESSSDNDPVVARLLGNLAVDHLNLGRYEESLATAREALPIIEETYGIQSGIYLNTLSVFAAGLYRTGSLRESETVHREVLAAYRKLLGDEHVRVAHNLGKLARVLAAQGRCVEAEALFREALDIGLAAHGEAHPQVAQYLVGVAAMLDCRGEYQEAEASLQRSLEINRSSYGDQHYQVADGLTRLATIQLHLGQLREAARTAREALKLHRDSGDRNEGYDLALLAILSREAGDFEQSGELFEQAIEIMEQFLDAGNPDLAGVMTEYAVLLMQSGEPWAAEPMLLRAVEVNRGVYEQGNRFLASSESILGECLVALERFDEAEQLLIRSWESLETALGGDDLETRRALDRLIALYDAWGRPDEAAGYRRRSGSP